MIIYYGSYTTTDGKKYLMGYDDEKPDSTLGIVEEVGNKQDEVQMRKYYETIEKRGINVRKYEN